MQEIFAPGFGQVLEKRLGMKPGSTSPAPILTPEITPVLALENDRPEWAFLAGEHLLAVHVARDLSGTTPDAAWLTLRNPLGSGVLLVIERVRIVCQGGSPFCASCGIDAAGTVGVNAITPINRDTRWYTAGSSGPQTPVLVADNSGANLPATFQGVDHADAASGDNTKLLSPRRPVIIPPGILTFWCGAEQAGIDSIEYVVHFRVRPFQTAELVGA